MNLKKLVIVGAIFGATFVATTASARSGFEVTLNMALGTTGLSCNACHVGANSSATATTPIANTWRSVGANTALLASTDSDGDGFSNKQEASGTLLDFNVATISPFTKAAATASDVKRANVFIQGDTSAVEKAFTAGTANVVVAAGSEVLGGIAVDVYADPTLTAPITLLYKAGGAATTSTVYAVDSYANTNIPLAAADWALQVNGAVEVKQWPAGAAAGTHDIVVVRVTPTTNTTLPNNGDNDSNDSGSNDDDDNNNPELPCMADVTTPLMMFFALLMLGFMVKRKKT